MSYRLEKYLRNPPAAQQSAAARGAVSRRIVMRGKRARISGSIVRGPYLPPETWYEPSDEPTGEFTFHFEAAGKGFRHILTECDVRDRLSLLPAWMLQSLEVVKFSRMTRKKRLSPCYGMQWGNAIYLYPIEENLIEHFCQAPKPAQRIEAQMYGGIWRQDSRASWKLIWTEAAIRDFYLNNVLIHELGHILDSRNTSPIDRERYAEWFAVEHGYKPTRRAQLAEQAAKKYARKRHHRN
jgi:hypothetical protein